MVMLDTNMVLRYLLNDNVKMAEEAERVIDAGSAAVSIEVIAEVVYVLKGVYALKREAIADTIRAFLEYVYCRDAEILDFALMTFGKRNLDFVDCVLYAYHIVRGIEIATFDKGLIKLLSE